jgi:Ni,Fe-hydrogenase III small subunit
MNNWFIKGLQAGVVTTRYPEREENAPGVSPGLPQSTAIDNASGETLTLGCPTGALRTLNNRILVERSRCVHCFRCARGIEEPIPWETKYEWTTISGDTAVLPKAFQKSLHIRIVDAGDCGACLNEIKLLNSPFYNMHRLGFFITPTPRNADILLAVGPVTEHMKESLLKTYDAMPAPKRIMAVGACALNGGVFSSGFVTGTRLSDILPVDLEIPGCPPPPLAILHGLLVIAGRKQAGQPLHSDGRGEKEGGNKK